MLPYQPYFTFKIHTLGNFYQYIPCCFIQFKQCLICDSTQQVHHTDIGTTDFEMWHGLQNKHQV